MQLPVVEFRRLIASYPAFERFFHRGRSQETREADISTRKVGDLISRPPVAVTPDTTIRAAAQIMRDAHISCLAVATDGQLQGIVTARDFTNKVLAEGIDPASPVSAVMAHDPLVLTPDSLGSDILHTMLEHRIGHLPVVDGGKLVGMITQTDLTRFQAVSSALLVRDAATALRIRRYEAERLLARGGGLQEHGANLVLDLLHRGDVDEARVALVIEVQSVAEQVRGCCRRRCRHRRRAACEPHAEAAHRVDAVRLVKMARGPSVLPAPQPLPGHPHDVGVLKEVLARGPLAPLPSIQVLRRLFVQLLQVLLRPEGKLLGASGRRGERDR